MIERLLELVLDNVFEALILLFSAILMGILLSYIYWTSQVRKRDNTIRDMEASIEEKDVDIEKLHLAQEILKKQYAEIESLNRQLEEKKRDRIRLSQQINDKFVDFERNFKTQIENREQNIRTLNNQVNEKNESIDQLKNKVANLEEMNQESVNLTEQLKTNLTDFKTQIENREQNIRTLNNQVNEKNESIDQLKNKVANLEEMNQESVNLTEQLKTNLTDFKTQIENREQNIRTLNNQVNEKNESIDQLKNKVANLEEMNQESVNLTEQLKTNLTGLEKSVEEKMIEVSSINARMSIMQDDLTHIVGIGPKVSSVLRLTGIDNFTKLGSINLNKLKKILEAENPNLLRLTDPSTWPEQAKLASEEDWEALSTLQESLKGSRRTRQ